MQMPEENKTESVSSSNKLKRRKRVMRYFIDAVKALSTKEGMDNITIRSVSELAGYNSATLYNYFDSFEQLMAFSSIDMMLSWLKDLSRLFDKYGNVMDEYLTGWYSFCYHGFQNPAGYAYTYSSPDPDIVIKYFEDYQKTFPEEFTDIPDALVEMCMQKTLKTQEESVLLRCVDAGYIDKQDMEPIYQLSLILYRGFLSLAQEGDNTKHYLEYTEMFMDYFYTYVKTKIKKKDYVPNIPRDMICGS